MMRFSKYISYVVSLIVYFSSCQDQKQQWLNKYAEIKCAYVTDTTNRENDKSLITKAYGIETELHRRIFRK